MLVFFLVYILRHYTCHAFLFCLFFFFFKQKTAYEMRISDWSSDVCSSDLLRIPDVVLRRVGLSRLHWRALRSDASTSMPGNVFCHSPTISAVTPHSAPVFVWTVST